MAIGNNLTLKMIITAVDQASGTLGTVGRAFDVLKGQVDKLRPAAAPVEGLNTAVGQLGTTLGMVLGGAGLAGLARLADGWANLQAKLRLVTTDQDAYVKSSQAVSAIAQRTASDLEATGGLYATLARALTSLGDTETDVAGLTETISQAMQLSGASAEAASGALTQLSQALASGALRGDEFNSIMEQAPRLSQALAASLGVTTGELRTMAEEGKLTAETVIGALKEQGGTIAAEFAQLPETFGRAMTRLSNTVKEMVGKIAESAQASALFGRVVGALEGIIRQVGDVLSWLGGVLGKLLVWFSDLPAPLQVVIGLWATMKVTGTDLFDVIGWLIGGLTSLALAVASGYLGWISFVGSLNLAKAAITALWGLMLAHPIGALVTVLGLGAAAWLTFRQSTEETAKSLADLRTKTQGQIEEIGKVRAAMAAAKPGSDAYNAAAKRLAELIPGMNLSLDAHGIVIARLGDGYADNASKADAYVKSLRDIDTAALAQQLALSYDAWQANSRAVADHTQRLKENYGIGQESSTWFQQAQLAVGRWTGEITRANQEGLKLNAALDLNQGQFKQLAEAVLQGAVSIEEITAALRRQGESETAIRGVETALRQMIEAAAQAGPKLSAAQQAAVLAGRNAAASLREAAGAVGTALTDLNKQIDEQQRKLSSAVQAESADWKALGEVAKGTYDGALAEVDRYAAARQAAIVTSGASERTQAAQLIALERETASARLAALQQYQATALGLIDAEGQRRVEVAQRTGGDAAAVEVAVLTAKRTALQQIEGEYRRHIDTLNTEAQRHLGEVRRIEDEIKALKLSTEDRIRELQRGGMTDYEAYQDRKRQAAEKASEAERAVATGDFALAQSLAKQSADLWAQNARAVTDGDKEVISSKQATTAAVQGVGQAAEIEARALQGLADSHKRQAASATTAAGQTEQALQGVATQLEQINQQLGRELRLKLEVDQTAVDALVKDLEQKLTSQTFLLKTQADLTQLATDIDKARKDIAANPAPLQILTDEAQTKIQGLKDALATLPLGDKSAAELALDVDKALKALETVETRLRALQQPLEARHTVASNVAEIQAQIDQLQVNTSSTHTVYVTTVQKKASGGLIQRFAAGGPVFRAPNWRLVPGLGNSDSVPAALASGSFVLRKTAATYYGSLLDRLSDGARRLAGPLVPALLTPGERIISPGTVGRYGAGLFAALNQLQVPRERLAALVDGLAGPVARFAAGGIVGGPSGALIGGGSVRTDTVNINLTIGAQTIPLQGAREQVGRLTSALRELRRGL